MEEDHIVEAQKSHADEPSLRRKRRRSAVDIIDLSEAAAPSSLRHLPRLRISPPKQNQPDPNVKHIPPPQESPIYLDTEPSPSKQRNARKFRLRQTSAPTAPPPPAGANAPPPMSPRRSSLRATVPTTRRSQWGEIKDTNPSEQANTNNNLHNNANDGDSDGFLARRLQAEEELRVARQRRALEYRMQDLECAEAEAMAAVAAAGGEQQQQQQEPQQQRRRHQRMRMTGGFRPPRGSRGASNDSRRLFSNSGGRYDRDNNINTSLYDGFTAAAALGRRSRRGGGAETNPSTAGDLLYREDTEATAASTAATASAYFNTNAAAQQPPTGARSGPRRGRGWPHRGGSSGTGAMGFSEAMSEFFFREAAAEMAASHAGWNHDEQGNEEESTDEMNEDEEFHEMMRARGRTGGGGGGGGGRMGGGPSLVPRRRGMVPGRPREGGPFSSILGELAALHQAVMGARSSALPSELLFSDRDFNEDDYEALLALDEGVENRKGAKQDVINQLHSERVPRGGGGQAAAAYGDCCICLDRIGAGQVVRKLECCHHFHKGCVDKWLKQKASCPICQRKIM